MTQDGAVTRAAGDRRTPWATGLLVSAFAAVVTVVAVVGFGAALTNIQPLLAVGFNLVVVGGAAPTVWRWRRVPVWRWVVYGVAGGVASGWAVLLFAAL